MNHKDFRILGLAASLRRASFHRGIVRAAHELAPERMSCEGFDLALTRFSGKQVSLPEDTDSVTLEAYSHEVVSFGFWH